MTDTPSAADALKDLIYLYDTNANDDAFAGWIIRYRKELESALTRAGAPQEVDRDWLRGFVDHVIQYALEDSKQFLETRMRDKLIDDFTEQRNLIGKQG